MKKTARLKFLVIAAAVFIFFSSTGVKCLKEKEAAGNIPAKTSPTITKTPAANTVPANKPTATPAKVYLPIEQAAMDSANTFIILYTNYKWGDFSNWDPINGKLTEIYQKEITAWIEQKKKESKNQPVKYISYSGVPQKTELMKINESKAEVKAEVEQEEVYGTLASRTSSTGPTSVWVNENGIETPYDKIQRKVSTKTFYVFLVKEGGVWKVDSITIIN